MREHTKGKSVAANNLANKLLMKLDESSNGNPTCKKFSDLANQTRFCTEMENGNFESAKIYLSKTSLNKAPYLNLIERLETEQALKQDQPYNENLKELAIAIVGAELDEKPIEPEVTESPKAASEPQEALVAQEEAIEESEIEFWKDPKAIHDYFKNKKALLAKMKLNKNGDVEFKPDASWIIRDKKYNSKADDVYKLNGKDNYYVYLDKHLCPQEQMEKFTNVLTENGIVRKAFKCNGLKFFKNVVEIKTNGDARAWANEIYVNDNDEYLIIINHFGNHKSVNRSVNNAKKIDLIRVESDNKNNVAPIALRHMKSLNTINIVKLKSVIMMIMIP